MLLWTHVWVFPGAIQVSTTSCLEPSSLSLNASFAYSRKIHTYFVKRSYFYKATEMLTLLAENLLSPDLWLICLLCWERVREPVWVDQRSLKICCYQTCFAHQSLSFEWGEGDATTVDPSAVGSGHHSLRIDLCGRLVSRSTFCHQFLSAIDCLQTWLDSHQCCGIRSPRHPPSGSLPRAVWEVPHMWLSKSSHLSS